MGVRSLLTHTQDLVNHAVLSAGYLIPWLDLAVLLLGGVLLLVRSIRMHHQSRRSGY